MYYKFEKLMAKRGVPSLPHTVVQGTVEVLSYQISIRTCLEDTLIAEGIRYIVESFTFCCVTISVRDYPLRSLTSHLLTPNGFHILAEIELREGFHDELDNHQTMLMPGADTLHKSCRPQRLLVRKI